MGADIPNPRAPHSGQLTSTGLTSFESGVTQQNTRLLKAPSQESFVDPRTPGKCLSIDRNPIRKQTHGRPPFVASAVDAKVSMTPREPEAFALCLIC
jgi:hypothetical protein